MPRYLIEREFPDGRAIPQNDVGTSPRRTVVDNKTGAGATLQACVRLALLLGAIPTAYGVSPATLTVNDSGDAGDGTCTSVCTLRDAIANVAPSGTIDFAPALLPSTITLTQGELFINNSLQIQGPGPTQLAISANSQSRVLNVSSSGGSISISGVTLRDGAVIGADGTNGPSGSGAGGSNGKAALGGCVYVHSAGLMVLDQVVIRNCVAQGGNGGDGGSGIVGSGGLTVGGVGGNGGPGGGALGGGIYFYGDTLVLQNSSIVSTWAMGGSGGAGGAGGGAVFHGSGGDGKYGGQAFGGAVFLYGAPRRNGYVLMRNVTIAGSSTIGGSGGNGGSGDSNLASSPGGHGGSGGQVVGGLVSLFGDESAVVDLEFATLSYGNLSPGSPGKGGSGKTSGAPGLTGVEDGAAIYAYGSVTALSTIIVGGSAAALCSGGVQALNGSANLAEDNSCPGFTLHGSFVQVFRPFALGTPSPAYMPQHGSVVIDAATSCNDVDSQPVTTDQHGTPRPQGTACDLGAIEADYIFVDGFE